jgi:hypothetical protein
MKKPMILFMAFFFPLIFSITGCKKADTTPPDNNSAKVTLTPLGEITYAQPIWVRWYATGISSISVTQNGAQISNRMVDSVRIENPISTQIIQLNAIAYDGVSIYRISTIIVNGPPLPLTLSVHSKGNIPFNTPDTLFWESNGTTLNLVYPNGNRVVLSPVAKGFLPMGKLKRNASYTIEVKRANEIKQESTSTTVDSPTQTNYFCDYGYFGAINFEMKRDWRETWENPPWPPTLGEERLDFRSNGDFYNHYNGGASYSHWYIFSNGDSVFYDVINRGIPHLDSISYTETYRAEFDSAGVVKHATYRVTYNHPANKF